MNSIKEQFIKIQSCSFNLPIARSWPFVGSPLLSFTSENRFPIASMVGEVRGCAEYAGIGEEFPGAWGADDGYD